MRLFCGCILVAARDDDDDAGDDIWPGIICIFCDLNAFASGLSGFMMILLSANDTKLMLFFVMVCCDKILIFGGIRWVVVVVVAVVVAIVVVVVDATEVDSMALLFLCDANCDEPFDWLELSTAVGVSFVNFGADVRCWYTICDWLGLAAPSRDKLDATFGTDVTIVCCMCTGGGCLTATLW